MPRVQSPFLNALDDAKRDPQSPPQVEPLGQYSPTLQPWSHPAADEVAPFSC